MAAHGISIAKASLLAACLRPDVTKLNRDDLNQFHDTFQSTLLRCTPSNIQTIKDWLLKHILPSQVRSAAVGKYLATTSKHVGDNVTSTNGTRPCRQRLHIVYVLNDILHHIKYHDRDPALHTNLVDGSRPILRDLFQYAAVGAKSRTMKRLRDVLDVWEQHNYYEREQIEQIRQSLSSNILTTPVPQVTVEKAVLSKELPWNLPSTHGDPSVPYFDLPAANLMPHIVPNSLTPIRSDQVRALHLSGGTADESLVNAVKDFLKDVNAIDNLYESLESEGIAADVDELGQLSYRNEAGDLLGDTYYGWSRAFCEKMKNRGEVHPNRSRSRSYSSEESRSWSLRKRRRLGSSRSRSRSPSPSRSQPRGWKRKSDEHDLDNRDSSRSYSPEQQLGRDDSSSFRPSHQKHPAAFNMTLPPPPVGSMGFPVPPPKPPNWQGPWPPPPPPFIGGPGVNGSGNPPLPPPPHSQEHGRGSGRQHFSNYNWAQR